MGNQIAHVMLVGCKNSGKTTLFSQLVTKKEVIGDVYVPTDAFNRSEIDVKDCKVTLTDVSGDIKNRSQWGNFYEESDGIIFMIDASKLRKHAQEVATTFWTVLSDKRMRNTPALVLVNKCDLLSASSSRDDTAAWVRHRLRLDEMHVNANVMAVSLKEGLGNINSGLEWLVQAVEEAKKVKLHDI